MLKTFKGGIHPYEGKELSADKPMQVIMPGKELAFPLSQHIGAPAKPIVQKGDKVLVGQKIAEAGGFISAHVICSVSGTVKGIEPRLVANGSILQSSIVENDGEYKTIEGFGEKRDYTKLSKQEIRDIVKEAGISKGLLFHYFENKAGIYEFVYEYSVRYMLLELSTKVSRRDSDLFEVLKQVEMARMDAM